MAEVGSIWTCKIGEAQPLPEHQGGADGPMRQAVAAQYRILTGRTPDFIFSGWGGELTEGERAAHEDRMPAPPTGADAISFERQRQIDREGYTAEHDDQHDDRELVKAAICYARESIGTALNDTVPPLDWPFEGEAWKPSERVVDLIKAGALIAAEIDRLQRGGGS